MGLTLNVLHSSFNGLFTLLNATRIKETYEAWGGQS